MQTGEFKKYTVRAQTTIKIAQQKLFMISQQRKKNKTHSINIKKQQTTKKKKRNNRLGKKTKISFKPNQINDHINKTSLNYIPIKG